MSEQVLFLVSYFCFKKKKNSDPNAPRLHNIVVIWFDFKNFSLNKWKAIMTGQFHLLKPMRLVGYCTIFTIKAQHPKY